MERDLAAFAASHAPPAERARVAGALARAVAELHGRGRVHGALCPGAVRVLEGGAIALAPPSRSGGPLARAGWDAPEVARGGTATPRSDAFSLGALVWLALAGRPPFEGDAVERVRKVLFVEVAPLRVAAPWVKAEVEAVVASLLEKDPRRRREAGQLARVDGGATSTSAPPTPTPTPTSTSTRTSTSTSASASTRIPTPTPMAAARFHLGASGVRAGLVALAAALAVVLLLPESGIALARDVTALIEEGDLAAARRRLDEAARDRPGDPLVEKLRGDLACARGAGGECVRRYRVALAARPSLRDDEALRANSRRLVGRGQPCGTRRAAAQLLGELRDPAALPALEAARRSGGIFAFLCTGDAIDRAIAATRAVARR